MSPAKGSTYMYVPAHTETACLTADHSHHSSSWRRVQFQLLTSRISTLHFDISTWGSF